MGLASEATKRIRTDQRNGPAPSHAEIAEALQRHLSSTNVNLKPCPFCGAGTTTVKENGKVWTGMKYSEPSSVSVQHWCEKVEGQPSRMIERVGRDHESAYAAWNLRAKSA